MSSELIPFDFDGSQVRIHIDNSGDPWWALIDVANIIGIKNPRDILKRLESSEYDSVDSIDAVGRTHKITVINESGLYRAIFRSDKPEAKSFQAWVFSDVLPAIRKTGAYSSNLPTVKNPVTQMAIDTLIRLDEMEQRQLEHESALAKTQQLALEALAAQQWVTIRQYVAIHQMTRQLPPGTEQQQYGRWLADIAKSRGCPYTNNRVRSIKSGRIRYGQFNKLCIHGWHVDMGRGLSLI